MDEPKAAVAMKQPEQLTRVVMLAVLSLALESFSGDWAVAVRLCAGPQ